MIFMAVLPIYTYGTSVLRKKAVKITEITDGLITLVKDMFETMHASSGIGLAANQVGSLLRVLVVDISDMEGYEEQKPLVILNPEILIQNGSSEMEEGCLSIPGLRNSVTRSEKISLRYYDINFHEKNIEADGLLSRVILHEVDHLNGKLFIDHIPKEEYKKLLPLLQDMERGVIDADYPVVSAIDDKKKEKVRLL